MKQRQDWIEHQVERAMDPLRAHLDGLKQGGQEDEAWDQALGLIGRLTARLATIEYDEKTSRYHRKSEQLDLHSAGQRRDFWRIS